MENYEVATYNLYERTPDGEFLLLHGTYNECLQEAHKILESEGCIYYHEDFLVESVMDFAKKKNENSDPDIQTILDLAPKIGYWFTQSGREVNSPGEEDYFQIRSNYSIYIER